MAKLLSYPLAFYSLFQQPDVQLIMIDLDSSIHVELLTVLLSSAAAIIS
jgi:hypothetical protein